MTKNIFKSFGAVLVGFILVAALSIFTDLVFEKFAIFPGASHPELTLPWMLVVALLYRSAYTVVGGFITARLAPQNPLNHVYILMVLGGLGGILGAVQGWHYGNHWYPVLLAVTGPFFVWVGGKLYKPTN